MEFMNLLSLASLLTFLTPYMREDQYSNFYILSSSPSLAAMDSSWFMVLVAGGAGFVAYLSYYYYYVFRRSWRDVPGPTPWPVLGSLHLLGRYPHHTFAKLAQQYGPIFLLRLGSQPTLIISSPALAKEILFTKDSIFAYRPRMLGADLLLYPDSVFLLPIGEEWRNVRKLCTMKLFASKRLAETKSVRQEVISDMLQAIRKHSQESQIPLNLGSFLAHCVSNGLYRLLISKKDADLQIGEMHFTKLVHKMSDLMAIPLIGEFIPYLGCLDFRTKRRMRAAHKMLDTFLDKFISETITSRSHGKEAKSTDFFDLLLSLKEEGKLKDSDVKGILLDLVSGGTATTTDMIEWMLAELLRHPRVLKKLRDEVDAVVEERDKFVDEADLEKLSYLQAVIKESLRLHPGVPFLVPRISREATQVGGYEIPEKTRVMVNVWAIGRSAEVWGQKCEEFIPERFMEEERKNIDAAGQHLELIPFGAGRRICLGMPLAMSMMQLMLANIVHSFDLQLPEGQKPEDMDMTELPAFTLRKAQPLIAVAKPRNSIGVKEQ